MWGCFYGSLRRHCTSDEGQTVEPFGSQRCRPFCRRARARTGSRRRAGGSIASARFAGAPRVPPTDVTPHAQDEVYVVVSGRGILFHDGKRDRFESGDLLFVAAGTEHRFEDYSDDLAVWVIFYGPPGGGIPR